MPYSDLFVGILIIILLAIAAYHVLSSADQPTRQLQRDESGKLVAIGEHQRVQGQWSGRGSQTSASLELAAGSYRIDYQFDAPTRLALIDANGDDTLFIKSGAGTEGLEIGAAGRYRFLIEPNHESAEWKIVYRQIV